MIAVRRTRSEGWTIITFIFTALVILAFSQALSPTTAAAIALKEQEITTDQDLLTLDELVGPQGPQGPRGEQGIQGETGATGATVDIKTQPRVERISSARRNWLEDPLGLMKKKSGKVATMSQ